MRNILMTTAAFMLLAGCGGEKTVYSDAEGNEVKVTREGDGDASEVKITSADGSATVNINTGATDAKLPFNLEVYPGAKVVSTMNSNSDGNQGAMVVMESSARPDAVIAWYRKSVEGKGFKIETEITTGDMRAIAGTKDGGSFTLQVAPAEAGSSITLIAGQG
ncbi:hypothetical protein C7451_106262 [Blastomonas natatoria]|uniref:Lipoprotein n=1 Tax=Blastomonas natatoria TaxID=34015 RepID=A0A2V3V2T0_9SPHN|nr:hypothetical protein [Blastomonas natatoria]PXW76096.1 hypothetical protein C7451_106262 [Blastomonas natatoria]